MVTAREKELEARIARLEAAVGRVMPVPVEESDDPTMRPDYIEFGSDEHLAWLGLVRMDNPTIDELGGFATVEGAKGTYRLVDPIGPYGGSYDPQQAAMLALRGKVAVFEEGPPKVHERAPEMWYPKDEMPELARAMRMRGR